MRKSRQQFHEDLLESVRQMKAGQAASITHVEPTAASVARTKVGLSQTEFANMLGVSVRTFQEWEQGRRQPTGAAKTLLRVAMLYPAVLKALPAA